LGRRKALVVWGYGLSSVTRPLMAVAFAPWHVLATRFLDRIGKGIRTAPRDALIADSVPAGSRGAAFGLYNTAIGIAALPASLLTGALWQTFGPAVAFGTGAGLAVLAAVALWLLLSGGSVPAPHSQGR
jgi:predicted MFS family arabinose efflux permease